MIPQSQNGLNRQVYSLLGMPIDRITMADLVSQIEKASLEKSRLFLSTPNLNFLIQAQSHPEFLESLERSDLCPADGMGILLVARLLGIDLGNRVAGSDIPAALQVHQPTALGRPFKLVLFGGEQGIAAQAKEKLNTHKKSNLNCVAAIDPGKMSPGCFHQQEHLNQINQAKADFLLVALGAQNGQAWIMQNMQELEVPVVSHLGATINFLAGSVLRAPSAIQKLRLEWAWRIKEEPKLAKRYINDFAQLLRLTAKQIIPLGIWLRSTKKKYGTLPLNISVQTLQDNTTFHLAGAAFENTILDLRHILNEEIRYDRNLTIDLSQLRSFDLAFPGLMIVLKDLLTRRNLTLNLTGIPKDLAKPWRLAGMKLNELKKE